MQMNILKLAKEIINCNGSNQRFLHSYGDTYHESDMNRMDREIWGKCAEFSKCTIRKTNKV